MLIAAFVLGSSLSNTAPAASRTRAAVRKANTGTPGRKAAPGATDSAQKLNPDDYLSQIKDRLIAAKNSPVDLFRGLPRESNSRVLGIATKPFTDAAIDGMFVGGIAEKSRANLDSLRNRGEVIVGYTKR